MKQTASYFKRENYYSEFNKCTEEKEKSNKMLMVTQKNKVKVKMGSSYDGAQLNNKHQLHHSNITNKHHCNHK